MAITNASRLADFGSGIGTDGSVLELDNAQQRVGIGTTNPQSTLQVGIAITMDGTAGVITAANFVGGGANLTALNGTAISSGTVAAARVATLNQNTTGTAGGLTGTPDITVRNITGVAATFTGVLTYEDVTNVDSVGIVTARGGLEVGAAGVGGTVSALGHVEFVGVTTIGLGLTLTDNIQARFGDAGDLKIYHDGSNSYVQDTGTGDLVLQGTNNVWIQHGNSENALKAVQNEGVEIRYNNSKKWETTETGTITTGISTADGFSVGDNEYITVGVGSDLVAYHDGTHTYITNTTGDLRITDTGGGGLIIGSNSLNLRNSARDENYFVGTNGGSAELYFNNNKKIETLDTGMQVTGVTSTTSFSVGPGLIQEKSAVPAAALTGTVNFDIVDDGMVHWHYTNASASWVVNLRGDASTTFNSLMDIGKTAVFTLYSASNNTSYYMTDFKIDGASITERWNGGSAPSAATGSGTDVYTFNIFKTGDAAYTVYATFSNFA